MGCAPSKVDPNLVTRPMSARSWMAADGWIISEPLRNAPPGNGPIEVIDTSGERPLTGEESPYEPLATRDFIGSPLSVGLTDEATIMNHIRNLRPGQYFIDADFPPNDSSLFYSGRHDQEIQWFSPKDLVAQPRLFVDGSARGDIMQGALGDCWFLSSCAAVCQKTELMNKILPDPQVLYGSDYKGVVHFRFWRYGQWVDVYIDDKLPTKTGHLIYAHDTDTNEFWVSLVEKAYAKLHGSYEAIEGGQSMDALVDLTGGIAERYELSEHTQDLYLKLSRAAASGSFITCSRKGNWKTSSNEVDENGLIAGHAYTITDVKRIKRVNGTECLLRIRNPWGYGDEWKGAWSDKDHRWQLIDEQTKKELQFVEKGDGEFWMCFKDFCQNFQEATICTVGPDFDGDGSADVGGQILLAYGKWIANHSAGGCRNDMKAFATNPQYLLTVDESDDQDPGLLPNEKRKSTCSVIVALMQEHRRTEKNTAVKLLQIGFSIYKTDNPDQRLPPDYFMYNYETAKSGTYVNFREVCGRFELEPGQYVVIPSTYNKEDPGDFMLRVFSRKHVGIKALPDIDGSTPATTVTTSGAASRKISKHSNLDYDLHIVPPPLTETLNHPHPFDPGHEEYWQPELPSQNNMSASAMRKISQQRTRPSGSFSAY